MGLAAAQAFAEAGAAVALADLNTAAVQAGASELTAAGHQALAVTCDVSDENQVADTVAQTVTAFGRLDMAFNNAGIQVTYAGSAEEQADDFDLVNAVNYRGVWAAMKHELRHMRSQGSGAIVNCSSIGGLGGGPGRAAYCASKHAVIWAHQERRQRVRTPRRPGSTPSVPAPSTPRWSPTWSPPAHWTMIKLSS